ncbi:MAG: 30S ribosome-binding factor RbfA [Eubacteriales bacterium]
MKKKTSRMIRINEEIKRELSSIIRSLKDPRIHPMTTIIEVDATNDLKHCKVFISVLGKEEEQKDSVQGLNNASSYIRTLLARTINLRNTPEIKFVGDQSIERSIRMSKLIDEVNKKE